MLANKISGIPFSGETVTVNIVIDDAEIFAGTDVRLKNITHGTQVVQHISAQGSVSFSAKAGDTFKVEVDNVEDYKIESTESYNLLQLQEVRGNLHLLIHALLALSTQLNLTMVVMASQVLSHILMTAQDLRR